MKNIYIFLFAFTLSMALTNCGEHSHGHNHSHEEGHAHESCSHDHSHDAEAHEHEHEHEHEAHSHDAHNHEHAHAHAKSDDHAHNHAEAGHSHGDEEPMMLTAYGEALELFAEVGKLQAGEESFILAHLTTLSNFKPLDIPEVTFTLTVNDTASEYTAARQKPGIYRCHIKPTKGGKGTITCKATIDGTPTTVAAPISVCSGGHHHHAEEAHHEHGTNMVTFPKEQSWKIDFATEAVENRTINNVVKGVGKVSNAPENVTTLVAATSGKVFYGNSVAVGRNVKAGESLFALETGDVTDGNAAIKYAEAESRYNYTKAEYERKAELVKSKVVSLSDFQATEAAYLQAKAVYENLKKNFNGGKMLLKSPITGYISDIAVEAGDYVTEGTPLATLQRDGELKLFCEVSVRHAAALRNLNDVNIELNDGRCYSLAEVEGRIVGVGRAIQNDCNMIPVTVMAKNLDGVVPGNIVTMYMISPADGTNIVVPRTALVEEMGRFFVFVQHTPVMFEKRPVITGVSDGKNIQLLEGVKPGERIVTTGAISLKLAQGTGALDPHAGHVH